MGDRTAYLVGSGIASLATAAFLIRDGGFSGENIIIIEENDIAGGSLDGGGGPEKGYALRGGRMFNFSYACTYDLLSFIPSLEDSQKSVREEVHEFNRTTKLSSSCRLLRNGQCLDSRSMGFSYRDRFDLLEVMMTSEENLGTLRIQDCFAKDFFETNFWYMWATMFSFLPWQSAVEFRRYLHRFLHEFPRINTLEGVERTPYNQYDSLVDPLVKWLKRQGVHFMMDTEVVDLSFNESRGLRRVAKIHYRRNEDMNSIAVEPRDLVFVTNGSITAASSFGSMKTAPLLKSKKESGAWLLWERLAKSRPEFGRPETFDSRPEESMWMTFTVTLKDPLFHQLMEEVTGERQGSGGLVTITDSNWLVSVMLNPQPHFRGQPKEVKVLWGYGLFIDRVGNYVKKKMRECSGEEILIEVCSHLRFAASLPKILETATCIPCLMPFIGSGFLPREPGDRPQIVPEGYANFAFIGQFCEIPDDVVFTVEYSVRSARAAVIDLLELDLELPPVIEGSRDIRVVLSSLKSMFRGGEEELESRPRL